MEYGIVVAQSTAQLRKKLTDIIENIENELTSLGRELFRDLQMQFYTKDEKISEYDKKIAKLCRENEVCKRLTQVQGVGSITATALVATIGMRMYLKMGVKWRHL
jgi:transposase